MNALLHEMLKKIELKKSYKITLANYHIKHGIDLHEEDSIEKISKTVDSVLKQEKHLFKKKFACRLMKKNKKHAFIILWDELGFAELEVVDCDEVTKWSK